VKIWWGILGVLGFGLVLYVVTNVLGMGRSSQASSTESPAGNGDPWWDWTGYGSEETTDQNGNGGWLGTAWDAGPGYAYDVWSALTSGAE